MAQAAWSGILCLPSSGIASMHWGQAREAAVQVKVLAKEARGPEFGTHKKPSASPCLVTMLFLVTSDLIITVTPLVFPLSVRDSVCLPPSGLKVIEGEVLVF